MTTQTLDPRIGVLNPQKFYCFPNGHSYPEFIGTLEEVEQVLGIRKNTQKKNLRQYVVTVIPSIVAYAGGWKGDSYDVEVSASSHTNAITKVRQQRNESEGHYAVPCQYRVKVLK